MTVLMIVQPKMWRTVFAVRCVTWSVIVVLIPRVLRHGFDCVHAGRLQIGLDDREFTGRRETILQ
jgi:hypothetical protein